MMDVEVKGSKLRLAQDAVPSKEANVIYRHHWRLISSAFCIVSPRIYLTMVKIMSGMELKELDRGSPYCLPGRGS